MRANKIICFAVRAGAVVAVGGFGDNQRRIDIDATIHDARITETALIQDTKLNALL